MIRLDFKEVASELISIDEQIKYLMSKAGASLEDYALHMFDQTWGNTSGGFERFGGSAMTMERTYVLVPYKWAAVKICFVFFKGEFAYSVPYSEKFISDVKERSILGKSRYTKYLEE